MTTHQVAVAPYVRRLDDGRVAVQFCACEEIDVWEGSSGLVVAMDPEMWEALTRQLAGAPAREVASAQSSN